MWKMFSFDIAIMDQGIINHGSDPIPQEYAC